MNYGGDVQIFPKIDNFIMGQSPDKKDVTSGDKKTNQIMIDSTHLM